MTTETEDQEARIAELQTAIRATSYLIVRAEEENERLHAWLYAIEDRPCTDVQTLREWARRARLTREEPPPDDFA